MLFTSCCLVALVAPFSASHAQQAAADTTQPATTQVAQAAQEGGIAHLNGSSSSKEIQPTISASTPENIVVKAQRLLVKEKNSASAVTELGTAAIAQTGVSGSVATLLRQVPSIYVYQQGIGNNEPVLSIRGVRGLETAQTLDGVPTQDLLSGGSGAYLQNNVGGRFNLDQISGVSVYPGVAYPDQNTFGTIGGTIAYSSKRPTDEMSADVFGSIGSFGTYNEGITLNTGKMNGWLGSGDDAPKLMMQYSNLQTQGFIDNTAARYNNFEAAFDKPYDGGLSKFQATILYNTGNGLIQSEPTPLPYLKQNGLFSNYPSNLLFQSQANDYLTIILKDDTYINDYVQAGVTAFYEHSDSTLEGYGNINLFTPPGYPNPNIVGGAGPFVQNPAGFGEIGLYGPGNFFYSPLAYTYNPQAAAPVGSKLCPAYLAAAYGGGPNPCGLNAQLNISHNDTYGIQPRLQIIPPDIFGIGNTIKIGGLVAKESSPNSPSYLGATPNVPQTPGNLVGGYDGGTERVIYQGYVQDKIDFFQNTLHLTPGATLEGSYSEINGSQIFGGKPSAATLATPYCQAGNYCLFGQYNANKWDREFLPFFNIDYDFDKIAPVLKGLSVYGSVANSALFAPVGDFSPNLLGNPPNPSIVHMYEGGIKYNTPKLYVSLDYFYQKVDRDFGFFQFQTGPQAGQAEYTNAGQREFKGLEAAVQYQITPEIQLFGNASHTLAKYLATSLESVTIFQDQFGLGIKGTPNTGVPDIVANFGAEYTKKSLFTEGDNFDLRLDGEYTGHQYTTYDLNGFTNVGALPGVGPPGSYNYYNVTVGSTTYDKNGGINPFVVGNLDVNYTLPTPGLAFTKSVKFDLNVQNLFNQMYYQYFYKQVSPTACPPFTSGPFKGLPQSSYGCTPQFADALPGEPFAVTFTASVHF